MPTQHEIELKLRAQLILKRHLRIPDYIPPANIPPDVLEKIRLLEEQANHHAHEDSIIAVKRQRNRLLPVSRLPDEVLSNIFDWVQEANSEYPDDYFPVGCGLPRPMELAWVAVTHVCYDWRVAALCDPMLWTRPSVCFRKWMKLDLERSKNADLIIMVDDDQLTDSITASIVAGTILRHMPHIKELYVSEVVPTIFLNKFSEGMYGVSAPRLQKLSLSYRSPLTIPLVNAFLNTTNLQAVILDSVYIHWESAHFFTDKVSMLSLATLLPQCRPSMPRFRAMLRKMTSLKTLMLQQALPVPPPPMYNTNALGRAHLQSLEFIAVHSEGEELEYFFNNVAFSPSIRCISVQAYYNDLRPDLKYRGLVSCMNRALAFQNIVASTRSMHLEGQITLRDKLALNVKTSASLIGPLAIGVSDSEDDDTSMKLNIMFAQVNNWRARSATAKQIFSELGSQIAWACLSELDLSILEIDMPGFSKDLAESLGVLSGVDTISIGRGSAKAFMELLAQPPESHQHSSSMTPVPFAGLKHLKLWDVAIDQRGQSESIAFEGHLRRALQSRLDREVGLTKLSLFCCHRLATSQVEKLKRIVRDVVWEQDMFSGILGNNLGATDIESALSNALMQF